MVKIVSSIVLGLADGSDLRGIDASLSPLNYMYIACDAEYVSGGDSVLVIKLIPDLSNYIWAFTFGGEGLDRVRGLDVDDLDRAHVVGITESTTFPVPYAYQPSSGGGAEGFYVRLDYAGSQVMVGTYLGGNDYDIAWDVEIIHPNKAAIVGETYSSNFPVDDAYQVTYAGGADGFLTVLNVWDLTNISIDFSTYLGGASRDGCAFVAVDHDPNDGMWCYGHTSAPYSFPEVAPVQGLTQGGPDDIHFDAFIAHFSRLGVLTTSTRFGGNDGDVPGGLDVGNDGCVYLHGHTRSTDFPLMEPMQDEVLGTGDDAFLVRFCQDLGCCIGSRGNVDGSAGESPNVSDLTFLTAYLFSSGSVPPCPEEADMNGDGSINIQDMTYLVAYLFSGGPAPAACP